MTDISSDSSNGKLAHSTIVEWAVGALTVLSAIALSILLFVTFISVIMRYVFAAPVLGSNEIIQLTSVVLIMLAMPLAAQSESHVRVDVFDKLIGTWGRTIGDVISRAVAMYILWRLVIRSWQKLWDVVEFGDATNMLQIPLWPFYGLLCLGAALYAIVLLLQILDVFLQGVEQSD